MGEAVQITKDKTTCHQILNQAIHMYSFIMQPELLGIVHISHYSLVLFHSQSINYSSLILLY